MGNAASEATWDVLILNFDGHTPPPLASLPRAARSMGPASVVRGAVDEALADVDWSDPRLGILTDGPTRLAIDLGGEGDLDGFVIHARGGASAASLIAHLCLVNGWAVLDAGRGVFLDLDEPDHWIVGPPGALA